MTCDWTPRTENHSTKDTREDTNDPGSVELSDFDLSSRFGGGDFDRRPPVVVTNTIGADDPRWRPAGRRPEPTTPPPDPARRPPQPLPQPLAPFNFNWLWRPNLYAAGRTPASTLPHTYTPPHTAYNAQAGAAGGPQLFLVPLYVPIR